MSALPAFIMFIMIFLFSILHGSDTPRKQSSLEFPAKRPWQFKYKITIQTQPCVSV